MIDGSPLPKRRRPMLDVERDLAQAQARDLDWEHGAFENWWPEPPDDVIAVSRYAAAAYQHTNGFFAPAIPSLKRLDAEVKAMAAAVVDMPQAGAMTLTVGGTESNYLAVKAARDKALAAGRPAKNIVIPDTGHPSFDKHGDMMGHDVIRVPVADDWRADPEAMAAAVDAGTFMLVGSAPSYSFGVVDPITELGQVALDRGIWLHVDACVGAFILPFIRRAGRPIPAYSLAVPGVASISGDLHKFGFCPTGISTLALRDGSDLGFQRFVSNAWPGGTYVRNGFVGSRSGGIVAAAWATLQILGEEGYLELAARMLAVADRLVAGVGGIEPLRVVGGQDCGVVAIASDESAASIGLIAATLAETQWSVGMNGEPPSLHLLTSPLRRMEAVDDFVEALAWSTGEVAAGRGAGQARVAAYSAE